MKLRALLVCLFLCLSPATMAVGPGEILPDAALEQRARDISAGLRCLVCQNQSIDDSDADLARDLRILVRERLVAGDTNAEVEQYIVDRYGEYVLLNPRLGAHTLLLWAAAPLLLLIGLMVLLLARRRRPAASAPQALTAEEAAALEALKQGKDRP
jgi:cytochrome c-type biogenesis protein CcmH